MTEADLNALIRGIAGPIKEQLSERDRRIDALETRGAGESNEYIIADVIGEELGERDAKILALEAKVAALEARPTLGYRGVWSIDEQYNLGNFATSDGSLWHCNKSTRSRPGTDASWTLCCKRGQNGKDLR
jgi:hypothetical protein